MVSLLSLPPTCPTRHARTIFLSPAPITCLSCWRLSLLPHGTGRLASWACNLCSRPEPSSEKGLELDLILTLCCHSEMFTKGPSFSFARCPVSFVAGPGRRKSLYLHLKLRTVWPQLANTLSNWVSLADTSPSSCPATKLSQLHAFVQADQLPVTYLSFQVYSKIQFRYYLLKPLNPPTSPLRLIIHYHTFIPL